MSDRLTFYRSGLKREWRWRFQNGGNNKKMANAGESYQHLEDAMASAFYVLNIISSRPKYNSDTAVERASGEHVEVVFKNSK